MINRLGSIFMSSIKYVGEYVIFTGEVIRNFRRLKFKHTIKQMVDIGTKSLPITSVTLMFVGMVFTTQVAKEFTKMGAGKMIGGIVGFAIWRELGPLFTGVVVAARVGAAISTHVAAMKVTEQISALRSMAINPYEYLYGPRLVAMVLMMPLLFVFADFIGFIAGLIVYAGFFHGNPFTYIVSASQMLDATDIYGGILIKGPIFGFIIASFAVFIGSKTENGAAGIGKAATTTVVSILIALFVVNFFLSLLLF